MVKVQNPLTQTEKEWVLKETSGLPRFFSAETKAGMIDKALEKALKSVLGIFGGSGGPEQLWVSHQGAGLKIWRSRGVHNHVLDAPLFAGKTTVAMAQYAYGIRNPGTYANAAPVKQ